MIEGTARASTKRAALIAALALAAFLSGIPSPAAAGESGAGGAGAVARAAVSAWKAGHEAAAAEADVHVSELEALLAGLEERVEKLEGELEAVRQPVQQAYQEEGAGGQTALGLPAPEAEPVWQSARGSDPLGSDAQPLIDADLLVEQWDRYYSAHRHTGYGQAIAAFRPGDTVVVDGTRIAVDRAEVWNMGDTPQIADRMRPGGDLEGAYAFQTCYTDDGAVDLVVFGHAA